MSMTIGSQRGPNRREYLIGCALQAVVKDLGSNTVPEIIADRAIAIGSAVHDKLQAEYEAMSAEDKAATEHS